MWYEDERSGTRVERLRMAEVVAAGVDTVAVACPFCLTMLDSAAKALPEGAPDVQDVAEVLAAALCAPPDPPDAGKEADNDTR
jgi:Fe-S oxidoreductase